MHHSLEADLDRYLQEGRRACFSHGSNGQIIA